MRWMLYGGADKISSQTFKSFVPVSVISRQFRNFLVPQTSKVYCSEILVRSHQEYVCVNRTTLLDFVLDGISGDGERKTASGLGTLRTNSSQLTLVYTILQKQFYQLRKDLHVLKTESIFSLPSSSDLLANKRAKVLAVIIVIDREKKVGQASFSHRVD